MEVGDSQVKLIKRLAGYCMAEYAIANCLDLTLGQWQRLKANRVDVQKALDQGKAVAEKQVSASLFRLAKQGNVTAAIWIEKTRFGRTEKSITEITGAGGGPVRYTTEERKERVEQLLEVARVREDKTG